MSLANLKNEATDIQFIQEWLKKINETDQLVINEVMELMRTNNEYRIFILDYAKGLIK